MKLFTLFAAAGLLLGMSMTAQAHPNYGCASCHVPHGASTEVGVPLWNPDHTTTTINTHYTSDTLDAAGTITAPDGASKLCLSCHDGSYAYLASAHPDLTFTAGNLGGIQQSHPISFVYDQTLFNTDGELVDPSTLDADILDANQKMQCISCHDIHDGPTQQYEPDLRWNYEAHEAGVTAAFCRNCHNK